MLDRNHRCILSANDTTLVIPIERHIHNSDSGILALDNDTTIFNPLKLTRNKTKTVHINFNPNNIDKDEWDWQGLGIPDSTSKKSLGITVDKNLSWQYHID